MRNLNFGIKRRNTTEFILRSVIITWKKKEKSIAITQKSGMNS